MDIFNTQKVDDLERKLAQANANNAELKRLLAEAEAALKQVIELKNSTPEDCIPGEYCRSCEFAKEYYYHAYAYGKHNTVLTGWCCGKGYACKNFMQKEVMNK